MMAAYLPRHPCSVVALFVILVVGVLAGAIVTRARAMRVFAATAGVGSVGAVSYLLGAEPPGFRMVAIVVVTLVAMKIVTVAAAGTLLRPHQWLAFVGWGGMRPALFASLGQEARLDHAALVEHGLRAIVKGVFLLLLARLVAPWSVVTATVLALPALSLIVHFGLFDLMAAFWRRRGVPCGALFRSPLRSKSLSEFWSRRWNVGYSEMIATVVHRPIAKRFGSTAALFASFLASGLLHELAISVPVRAGYGLPTAYFVLHGFLVAAEKRMSREPGPLWTLSWLVAPLPLLFHGPFIRGVIWPLIGR